MKLIVILGFTLLFTQGYAQRLALPEDAKATIQRRIDQGIYPGVAVGMVNADGTAYFSFGVREHGGARIDEHTVFEIGSISKTFTAALLAYEVVEGRMKLDDPAQQYLPETVHLPAYEGQQMTLGNLSDHTSSLPRLPSNMAPADNANPYADYSVDQLYAFLSSYTLPRPVGSQYEYSNLGAGLLGHILSRFAGKTFEELLLSRITRPLYMGETGITLTPLMKKNLASGHANGEKVPNWDLPTLAGAGAIRSSVHDMLIYLNAQMEDDGSDLFKAMQLTQQIRHNKAGDYSVGLGWHILPQQAGPMIWHNGGTGGYRTFTGFDPARRLGVVVMTNSDESVDDIGFHLLLPDRPMDDIKPDIVTEIKKYVDKKGDKKVWEAYTALKAKGTYAIRETTINALGYQYLGEKKTREALAVLDINVREFPNSFNVYDSYGEALMENGNTAAAIVHYQKSLELNPGNTNAIDKLAVMGVQYVSGDVPVDDDLLDSYTGTYQLAPGFNIVITRQGHQLIGQATGQSSFEMFPKSDHEFYLNVAEARAVFSKADNGLVTMTWYQGGQAYPCKRL